MKHSIRSTLICFIYVLLYDETIGFVLQRFVSSKASPQLFATMTSRSVCCILENSSGDQEMNKLASQLNIPILSREELFSDPDCIFSHFLTRVPYQYEQIDDFALAIASLERGSTGKNKRPKVTMKPFFVDFFPPSNSRLGKRASGESGRDLLIKAVSLPKQGLADVSVYDLTAGFGQDALLIAKNGAKQVHMVERNPIVACLLGDALRRLVLLSNSSHADDKVRSETLRLSNILHLIQDDGVHVAKALTQANEINRPDIIYLDPMFPERKKSASVKKNMQILHGLLESQDVSLQERLQQEQELLLSSFDAARQRVVVKRPKSAHPLGHISTNSDAELPSAYALDGHDSTQLNVVLTPAYALDGPVNRWDVYVKRRIASCSTLS